MPPRSLTVGIDVGGTFTDLLAVDPVSNEVKLAKVPTTVDNQAIGFMAALAAAGADPATVHASVPQADQPLKFSDADLLSADFGAKGEIGAQ